MAHLNLRLCLALSLAVLFLASAGARAETYTELFIGGVHTENDHIPFTLMHRYPNGVSAKTAQCPGASTWASTSPARPAPASAPGS